MNIIIRDASPADLNAVSAMEATSARNPWTRAARESEISLDYAHFLVAELDSELAGLLDIHIVGGDAHINDLITDIRFRRMGIARALLCRAIELAWENGCEGITLEVRANNSPAIALYQGAGFQMICTKPNFYRNPDDDGVAMLLTL